MQRYVFYWFQDLFQNVYINEIYSVYSLFTGQELLSNFEN